MESSGERVKRRWFSTVFWLFALVAFSVAAASLEQVPVRPTPMKVPLDTAVRLGDGYGTLDQPFDVRITVLEVRRGDQAWGVLHSTSESNSPPRSGFEYLIARIRFELTSETGNYAVTAESFRATAANGKEYESVRLQLPDPALHGRLYAGDSLEGWVAFLVAKEEMKPLMTFGQGGIDGPGQVWFQLY